MGSIGFTVNINVDKGELCLRYAWANNSTGEKEEFNYPISLVPTVCHYGGRRWWFICPLTTNGVYCGKRIGRLHLTPNGKYFGCRHCFDLTYQSCQDSHEYDSVYKSLGISLAEGRRLTERLRSR